MSNLSKVMITGGRGFIGSYLTEKLLRIGVDVVRLDRKNLIEREGASVRDVIIDITQVPINREYVEDLVDDCDVVIHLAAQSDVNSSIHDPLADAFDNIIGTLAVLGCCSGAKKPLVYAASGGTIYGRSPEDNDSPSPYALSKKTAEEYCRLYSELCGLSYISLRLGNVFGFGGKGVIEKWLKAIKAGRTPYITGDGSQTRDYIYVEDVVEAFVMASEMLVGSHWPTVRNVLDVGSGQSISVLELAKVFQDVTGYDMSRSDREPLPAGEVKILESRNVLDNAIGWKPLIGLHEGIKKTMERMNRP